MVKTRKHHRHGSRRRHTKRRGGFIPYYNPFTGTYHPYHKKEYRELKKYESIPHIKQINKNEIIVEPSKSMIGIKSKTLKKTDTSSIKTAYNPEWMMNQHYDELKQSLLDNNDCLDEEKYEYHDDYLNDFGANYPLEASLLSVYTK